MAAVEWTPEPGSVLIEAQSSDTDIVATVTVEPAGDEDNGDDNGGNGDDNNGNGGEPQPQPDPVIEDYAVDPPLPDQVAIDFEANTLTVKVPHWQAVFLPEEVRYRKDGEVQSVGSLEEVPNGADITAFIATTDTPRDFELTVYATDANDPESSKEFQVQYTIRVRHNYSADRDALVEAIDAGGQ